ncbi:MAG: hypothetical protein AB8F34_05255 [Akkermansiaceae bacterium]
MQSPRTITSALAGVLLLGVAGSCMAQSAADAGAGDKDREIRRLKAQLKLSQSRYETIARDLASSKRREADLSKSVNELKLRFAALGDNLLNGDKDAILEAVKNAEVLDKRNKKIESAVHGMVASLREYLRTAIASDPDARVHLETSIRELDAAVGLRQKPRPQITHGTLQEAKIVSIDPESGVLVVNAGEGQSMNRGMTFDIMRGNRKVAEAIVADTKKDFSGLLPTMHTNPEDQIRIGDIATVKTVRR